MASYIDSNLTNGERVVLRANVSWWSQIWLLLFGVLGLAAFGLGLILIIIAVVRVLTTELALTNKRVIAKTGWIARSTIELRLDKVEGLVVNQGIIGRFLNYGTVFVTGTGGIKTPIPYISSPIEFRRVVNEYLENPTQFDNKV